MYGHDLIKIPVKGWIAMKARLEVTVDDDCGDCLVPVGPFPPDVVRGGPGDIAADCRCRVGEELGPFTPHLIVINDVVYTRHSKVFAQKCVNIHEGDPGNNPEWDTALAEANAKGSNVSVGTDSNDEGQATGPRPGGDCFNESANECCDKDNLGTMQGHPDKCCPNAHLSWDICPEPEAVGWGGGVPAAGRDAKLERFGIPVGGRGNLPDPPSLAASGDPDKEIECPPVFYAFEDEVTLDPKALKHVHMYAETEIGWDSDVKLDFGETFDLGTGQDASNQWESLLDVMFHEVEVHDDFGMHTETQLNLCLEGEGMPDFPDRMPSLRRISMFTGWIAYMVNAVLFSEAPRSSNCSNLALYSQWMQGGESWNEMLMKAAQKSKELCGETHDGWRETEKDLQFGMCRALKCVHHGITNGQEVLVEPWGGPSTGPFGGWTAYGHDISTWFMCDCVPMYPDPGLGDPIDCL